MEAKARKYNGGFIPRAPKSYEGNTVEEKKKETSLLDLPGVGASTAEKLKEAGYKDLMSVAVASPGELVDASGITESVARKMINSARSNLEMGFVKHLLTFL